LKSKVSINGQLLTQAKFAAIAALLKNGKVNDGGHTFGTVDIDFEDGYGILPGDIATGPGGLPGTAHTPNTASPGPGSMNPLDLPEPPPIPVTAGAPWPGVDGGLMPGITSPKIGKAVLGDIVKGESYKGSKNQGFGSKT